MGCAHLPCRCSGVIAGWLLFRSCCWFFSTLKSFVELCNRYSSLAPLYYRGASAAVVVYDITNPETFLKAQFWVKVRFTRNPSFQFLPLIVYHRCSGIWSDLCENYPPIIYVDFCMFVVKKGFNSHRVFIGL